MPISILSKKEKSGSIPIFARGTKIQAREPDVSVVDLEDTGTVEIVPLGQRERDVDIVDLEGNKILTSFNKSTSESLSESESLNFKEGEGVEDKDFEPGPRVSSSRRDILGKERTIPLTNTEKIRSAITTLTSPQFKETISDPKTLKLLGTSVISSSLSAIKGFDGASVTSSNLGDQFIGANNEELAKLAEDNPEISEFIQSLGFSLSTIAPAILTGMGVAAIPLPGTKRAAPVVGSAVVGKLAFNMVSYQITQEYLEMKNQESIQSTGKGITIEEEKALKEEFQSKATEAGLWEAIPEAAGSLIGFNALSAPLTKMFGKNVATKLLTKGGTVLAEELTTETITELGQSNLRYEAKLPGGKEINWSSPDDWKAALAAVAPMTAAITFVTGGTIGLGLKINTLAREVQDKDLMNNFSIKIKELSDEVVKNEKGFIKIPGKEEAAAPEAFKDFEDLSIKTLEKLEGKTTVSPQFISDLSNAPDLKQPERDLIRRTLRELPEGKVNVKDFADKIKTSLVPLETIVKGKQSLKYENIVLPDEQRGEIAEYDEHLYESPIKTSAGEIHFGRFAPRYFAHTRIEDLAIEGRGPRDVEEGAIEQDDMRASDTRRIIELQSDLFQRGRLKAEAKVSKGVEYYKKIGANEDVIARQLELEKIRQEELEQLQPYRNNWFERIIKEEIKQAATDGKNTLQFPTGETAMQVEGLSGGEATADAIEDFTEGETVQHQGRDWLVTSAHPSEGDMTAFPLDKLAAINKKFNVKITEKDIANFEFNQYTSDDETLDAIEEAVSNLEENIARTEDVDKSNPIYKFYEKDIRKYLKRIRPDMKRVTDEQGVEWFQLDITEQDATKPVTAFFTSEGKDFVFGTTPEKMKEQLTKILGEIDFKALDFIPGGKLGFMVDQMIRVLELNGKVSETVAYHEAFHYFVNTLGGKEANVLTDWILENKKDDVEALKKANPEQAESLSDIEMAEEVLANEFARYMRKGTTWSAKFKAFFDRLLQKIELFKQDGDVISELFNRIKRGEAKDLTGKASTIRKDFISVDPFIEGSKVKVVRFSKPEFVNTDNFRGGTWYATEDSSTFDFQKEFEGIVGGEKRTDETLILNNPLIIKDADVVIGSRNVIESGYENFLPERERELANRVEEDIFEVKDSDINAILTRNGNTQAEIKKVINSTNKIDATMDLIVAEGLRKEGYDSLILQNTFKDKVIDQHIFKIKDKAQQELDIIKKEIETKVSKKAPRLKAIKTGEKRGARVTKKIEVRVAKREVSAEKRQKKREVKAAVQETSKNINADIKNKATDVQTAKNEVVRFARKNLSLSDRGKLLPIMRDITSFKDLGKAKKRADELIDEARKEEALIAAIGKERSKVAFIKQLAQLNQTAMNHIKKKLGINRPLRKMSFEELERVVDELKRRLKFKRDRGLLPTVSKTDQEVSENVYLGNRIVKDQNDFSVKKTLGKIGKSLGEALDPIFTPISTRLKNIDQSLKNALRKFEFKLGLQLQSDRNQAKPFLKSMKNLERNDFLDLDLALKNGDAKTINRIVKKYNLEDEYADVKKMLDDIYDRADAVGFDIGYKRNYFPRTIKDTKGFMDYIQGSDDWSIIDEAIKRKETSLGDSLSLDEKASLINTMIRGYAGGIALSETGQMKTRSIDLIDGELNQFYSEANLSLSQYISGVNDAIEARRFFGKEIKILDKEGEEITDIDQSIGHYIAKLTADGTIRASQEKELSSILKARFDPKAMHGVLGVIRDLSYIDVLGSPLNALTQLGDLAFAFYKGGIVETVKNAPGALINKSKIKKEDLGIEEIGAEFAGDSKIKNVSDIVMNITGFKKLDTLGKNTLVSAAISRYQTEFRKSNPNKYINQKIDEIFGEEAEQVKRDLRDDYISENVKYLAFNELLDVQPVSLSEMPEKYLSGGNNKILYMLKTWTIKKLDVYRNDVFRLMKTDKPQALKNLFRLAMYLILMEAGVDELKDFVLGRETSFKDKVTDNIAKQVGFSRYTTTQITRDGLGRSLFEQIVPPTQAADSLSKDVIGGFKDFDTIKDVSNLRTIKSIPVGGKLYYYWFGRGSDSTSRKSSIKTKKITIPKINIKKIKIKPIKISI